MNINNTHNIIPVSNDNINTNIFTMHIHKGVPYSKHNIDDIQLTLVCNMYM